MLNTKASVIKNPVRTTATTTTTTTTSTHAKVSVYKDLHGIGHLSLTHGKNKRAKSSLAFIDFRRPVNLQPKQKMDKIYE